MKRKTLLLLLITFPLWGLGGVSCSKDDSKDPTFSLPPETQTGANTFGVTINGKVYVPRTAPASISNTSPKAMIFWGSPDNISWNELEIKDGASTYGFKMIIHLQNFNAIGVGQYTLHQSNFHNQIDSTPFTHIYFKIYDSNINNYAYYGTPENGGEINITRNSNGIVSGNFKGKFVRFDNPSEFIQITDGRFDINTTTLDNAVFP